MATSADGTRIAWYRYGSGSRAILFVPTWNIVDARVVGHQIATLERHATVVSYDPRGAGASERPERGYDFPHHAADALAVLEATGVEGAALVTASRGLNAAVLLTTDDPQRFDRLVAIAPVHAARADPGPRTARGSSPCGRIGQGSSCPSCTRCSPSRDSAELIAEMIAIGLESTPEVAVVQELEAQLEEAGAPARGGLLPDARHPRRERRRRPRLTRGGNRGGDAARTTGS